MNTSTVYVEPIFVGCLIGLALGLPFYSDLKYFYVLLDLHISGAFLGVFVIGAAYVIGIPADRLLDSLMEGLAKHCRIRFVLNESLKDDSIRQKILAGADPFPEDRYRTKALLHAGPEFNDWLQYIRTRVRITRALAFTIPSLTFAGLACLALKGIPSPALACLGVKGFPSPTALSCTRILLLDGGVPIAWISALLFVFLLKRYEPKPKQVAPKNVGDFAEAPSCLRFWRPAGRWHPPHTKERGDICNYVRGRSRECAKDLESFPSVPLPSKTSVAGLFLDVALQPFPVSSALLLAGAAVVACSKLGSAGLIPVGLGALLTFAVGYAWWRSTETFMTYLLIAGRELERSASRADTQPILPSIGNVSSSQ